MPGVLAIEDLVAAVEGSTMPSPPTLEDVFAEAVEGSTMPSPPTLEDVFAEAVGEG